MTLERRILDLLDEVEALRAERDALRAALEKVEETLSSPLATLLDRVEIAIEHALTALEKADQP